MLNHKDKTNIFENMWIFFTRKHMFKGKKYPLHIFSSYFLVGYSFLMVLELFNTLSLLYYYILYWLVF